jgi:hypothetical protein
MSKSEFSREELFFPAEAVIPKYVEIKVTTGAILNIVEANPLDVEWINADAIKAANDANREIFFKSIQREERPTERDIKNLYQAIQDRMQVYPNFGAELAKFMEGYPVKIKSDDIYRAVEKA